MKVCDISHSTIFRLCYPPFPLYTRNGATLGINDIAPWTPHLFHFFSGSLVSSVEDFRCLVTFSSYRYAFLFSSLSQRVFWGLSSQPRNLSGSLAVSLFQSVCWWHWGYCRFPLLEEFQPMLYRWSTWSTYWDGRWTMRESICALKLRTPVNGVESSRPSVMSNEFIVVWRSYTKVRVQLRTPPITQCQGLTVEWQCWLIRRVCGP